MSTDISIVNFFLHRPPSEEPFACVPMGPLYLSSAIEGAGYSIDFHDYQLQTTPNPYNPEAVADFLERTRSDLVGISCMTNMLPFLLLGLRIFKQRRPDTFVVLGGSAASGLAPEILASYAEVDAVLSGEGEEAIVEIVEARRGQRRWGSIAGLTFRHALEDTKSAASALPGNGRFPVIRNFHCAGRSDSSAKGIISNPQRARRMDVDSIAYPSYRLLKLEHYLHFPLLTARGCPYACTFCDIAPNWDRRVGQRSVKAVIEEIEDLRDRYNATTLSILDDVFSLNKKRVVEFCRVLVERRIAIEWSCMCRVDLLDEPLMDLMHKAGCRKVFLGIESGSERVRKLAGKGIHIENVEDMLAKTAARFEVAASFIMGFPFEEVDDFRETLYLIMYCMVQGARPQMSILSPLPQAELTVSSEYELTFDPDLVSGMVFPRYQERAGRMLQSILTNDVQDMIRADPKVFSAFYHFKQGRVQEKLELAIQYGLSF